MIIFGVATSAVNFFRSIGGTFGVALFGAIFASQLRSQIQLLLPGGGIDPSQVARSPAAIQNLPGELHDAVVQAIATGVHTIFLVALPAAVLGFALAWLLREIPLRETPHVGAISPSPET